MLATEKEPSSYLKHSNNCSLFVNKYLYQMNTLEYENA